MFITSIKFRKQLKLEFREPSSSRPTKGIKIMSSDNQDNSAKAATVVLGEIMRMAGDDPKAKAAAAELGQTALTLTKAVNNALLPLAAVNFGIEKARAYFSTKFHDDLAEKAKDIPPEELVEPKPSLAGPALQGLAFTHEERELREMFLNLLAAAMDKRRAGQAHPAFVEVIKQLTGDEAILLRGILTWPDFRPIAELRIEDKAGGGFEVLTRHVMDLKANGSPVVVPGLQAMLENWIRLGLIDVDYSISLAGATPYAYLAQRPEYLNPSIVPDTTRRLEWQHGAIRVTDFGKLFAKAIGVGASDSLGEAPTAHT